MSRQTKYVDFGISEAKSFFAQVAMPNVGQFEETPTVQSGLNAAWALWHLHDWHWHDTQPNREPEEAFRQSLCQSCPELKYLRDITDAAKHRGIGRSSHSVKGLSELAGRGSAGGLNIPSGGYGVGVLAYGSGTPQLRVIFDDDSVLWLGDIIQAAKDFWSRTLAAT